VMLRDEIAAFPEDNLIFEQVVRAWGRP